MADLIDRFATVDDVLSVSIATTDDMFGLGFQAGVDAAVRKIANRPAVDAVEVVRCKDCKHYDNSEGICWCNLNSKFHRGGMDWHGFPEDGYCSYGERSEEDVRL